MGENGAENSQVTRGNGGASDNSILVTLDELGTAAAIESHPEPGSSAGLLLGLDSQTVVVQGRGGGGSHGPRLRRRRRRERRGWRADKLLRPLPPAAAATLQRERTFPHSHSFGS